MMSQRQYSLLYWVTLGCSIFATLNGREIVGAILFLISALYLIGGDFAKRMEYGERKEGKPNETTSVVETST